MEVVLIVDQDGTYQELRVGGIGTLAYLECHIDGLVQQAGFVQSVVGCFHGNSQRYHAHSEESASMVPEERP